jgi:hypothetical protein
LTETEILRLREAVFKIKGLDVIFYRTTETDKFFNHNPQGHIITKQEHWVIEDAKKGPTLKVKENPKGSNTIHLRDNEEFAIVEIEQ